LSNGGLDVGVAHFVREMVSSSSGGLVIDGDIMSCEDCGGLCAAGSEVVYISGEL
jgi:hypothetical protein